LTFIAVCVVHIFRTLGAICILGTCHVYKSLFHVNRSLLTFIAVYVIRAYVSFDILVWSYTHVAVVTCIYESFPHVHRSLLTFSCCHIYTCHVYESFVAVVTCMSLSWQLYIYESWAVVTYFVAPRKTHIHVVTYIYEYVTTAQDSYIYTLSRIYMSLGQLSRIYMSLIYSGSCHVYI